MAVGYLHVAIPATRIVRLELLSFPQTYALIWLYIQVLRCYLVSVKCVIYNKVALAHVLHTYLDYFQTALTRLSRT